MTIQEIKELVNQHIKENYTGDITAEDVKRIFNETLDHLVLTNEAYTQQISGILKAVGYGIEDLREGWYGMTSVGNKYTGLNTNPVGASWGALRLAVTKGRTYHLEAKGGANAKAYAFTNASGLILEMAPEYALINATITAPEDGYLLINHNRASDTKFLLVSAGLPGEIEVNKNTLEQVSEKLSTLFAKETQTAGNFVSHGVIALNGSFAATTMASFDIYEYSVTPGQSVRIKTRRGTTDSATRAFAYAYNDSTPIALIKDANEPICDVIYEVPEGVNRICVYNNNNYAQSLWDFEGFDIFNSINKLNIAIKDNTERIETLEAKKSGAEIIYTIDDIYKDSEGLKSYYFDLTKAIAPTAPIKFTAGGDNWACLRIEVKKGQKLTIHTVGGSNGRAYAITDLNRAILVVAAAGINTITNPFIYTVTEDGYCYVNCTNNNNTSFKVIQETSIEAVVENLGELEERVTNIESENQIAPAPKISNPPIDIRKETKSQLRVLDIGNSFTDDPTAYLNGFITAAGIDTSDMCFYRCLRGGGSFKSFYDSWHNRDTYGGTTDPTCHYSVSRLFGGISQPITGTTALEKLHSCFTDCKWDLIIIHQVSNYSGEFEKWTGQSEAGYLTEFIRLIRLYQPQATIGYLMAHASYSQSTNGDTGALFAKIAKSVQQMRSYYGIDFIIPVAAAIENLRTSEAFKTMYPSVQKGYSRDAHHLGYGLARYVANAAYFQSLLGKRYGATVYGNTYRVTVAEQSTYPNDSINVTDDNAELAQLCAVLAYDQMYSINSPDNVKNTL